jgi:modulator of FtsH protease
MLLSLPSIPIADWSSYLAVQASVSATLTGLVFVAVSINLSRVLAIPGLPGRAAESLLHFLSALLISLTALIPGQTAVMLGTEVIVLAAVLWLLQTLIQLRYVRMRTGNPRSWLVIRIFQTQVVTLPFIASGVLLVQGSPGGMYWLVPGFLLSLISGVIEAWILLVEILR